MNKSVVRAAQSGIMYVILQRHTQTPIRLDKRGTTTQVIREGASENRQAVNDEIWLAEVKNQWDCFREKYG